MKQNSISPEDPRLTAYALDEMAPADRAEFELALAQDAPARQLVEEIRSTAGTLASALENEPMEPVQAPAKRHDIYTEVILFPYWKVSGLAAACFVAFFIYWQRNQILPQSTHYIEVPLTAPAGAREEAKAKTAKGGVSVNLAVAETAVPEAAPSVDKLDQANQGQSESRVETSEAKSEPKESAFKLADAEKDADRRATRDSSAAVMAPVTPLPETLTAQSPAPAPPVNAPAELKDEAIVLSPFEVRAPARAGFLSSSTLAGTRKRTLTDHQWGSGNGRKQNTETYGYRRDNDYLRVADHPLSTFSADVDTASYANVRRFLTEGQRPPADAVRIEELVNYFPYDYAVPGAEAEPMAAPVQAGGSRNPAVAKAMADQKAVSPVQKEILPFAANLEVASAPWAPEHRLVRIGLRGREINEASRPSANLVFLIDVSGSMNEPNKLPLVKQSLRMLVERLRPDDQVAIAVYAGASGLALASTKAEHRAEILEAIDRLEAGGSTNGAMGIQLAYDIAKANFLSDGVNRVILATDGDFNVGVTNEGELVRMVQEKAKSGVYLTVLGFGMGNLKDSTLEQLADKGNGNYAYIDSLAEAKKTLVEQAGGTLVTIAQDVKLQIEFNPAVVQAYRLIGYENRLLAKEEFKNDKVDAGEIGAGHTVTALYEVVPVGVALPEIGPEGDGLKYQKPGTPNSKLQTPNSKEMLTVKIRYKEPAGSLAARAEVGSRQLEYPLRDSGARFEAASPDFKFAAAVAAFGMVLRDSPHKGAVTLAEVLEWSRAGLGRDAGGYRNEFIELVERARQILP